MASSLVFVSNLIFLWSTFHTAASAIFLKQKSDHVSPWWLLFILRIKPKALIRAYRVTISFSFPEQSWFTANEVLPPISLWLIPSLIQVSEQTLSPQRGLPWSPYWKQLYPLCCFILSLLNIISYFNFLICLSLWLQCCFLRAAHHCPH